MSRYCPVEAVVIDTRAVGEADMVIALYTKEYGRIDAYAKSIRKMGAKLKGELTHFAHVQALLVHTTHGYRIVDAQGVAAIAHSPRAYFFGAKLADFFSRLVRESEEDPILWDFVRTFFANRIGLPTSFEALLNAKSQLLQHMGYADETHIHTEADITRVLQANHITYTAVSQANGNMFK